MQKLKLLFSTSRPISWVNTAYPFAVGYLVSGGSLDWRFWVGSLFFLIPYNLLMYGVNDVFDYESDIKNARKGGVEGAVTDKKYHGLILKTAFWLPAPFVGILLALGDLTSGLALAAVLFFVVAYSLKGLRFKEVPFLDSITSSIHFVGPLVYALGLNNFALTAWTFVLAFFFWGIASQALGAVQDINPDRNAGIKSIATIFGAQNTIWLCFIFYLAAIITIFLQGGGSIIVAIAGLAYVFNILPFANINDKNSVLARAAWKRFLWINYLIGAVVTIVLILNYIQR